MADWWGEGPLAEWPEWSAVRNGDALAPANELLMDETYATSYQGTIYGFHCYFQSTFDEQLRVLVVRRYHQVDMPGSGLGWTYEHVAFEDVADPEAAIKDVMTHLPDRLLEWLL